MEPSPNYAMILIWIAAYSFMFLVICGILLALAIADNIRTHIKRARIHRKRGTQCPS